MHIRKSWLQAAGSGLLAILGLLGDCGTAANADESTDFRGPYLGVTVGTQNVWGGSLIGAVDVLSQDRREVFGVDLGWRWQTESGWVFGAELQFGKLDGDFTLGAVGDPLFITYDNDSQFGFGGHVGKVLGERRRNLLYVYAYETEREFDVEVTDSQFGAFRQTDEQGFLRFGFGLETTWTDRLRSRVMFGSYRVDFGGVATNIDIDRKADINVGLVYGFGS